MKSKSSKIRTAAAIAAQNQAQETVRRMLKLSIVTLHDEFGFGRDRLAHYIDAFNRICGEAEHDEVFWGHVDQIVAGLGVQTKAEREG